MNYNSSEKLYNDMSIEQLEEELNKPGLMAEDRSLVIFAMARKRRDEEPPVKPVSEVIEKPED